jgi:ubiquinone/menaquinone biosynthesis C-methylase UbiE
MGWHGSFSLDEAKRRSWYNPELILEDLHSGMTFVDVGSGEGFFSILAAKKVGTNGRVYAVDSDPLGIEKLKNAADKEKITNITTRIGRAEETVFCEECADFVFFSMDLHDFDEPTRVLANARKMIKPSGRLVDLDWKKQDMPFGPPERIRFSEKKVAELLDSVGFSVESTKEAGRYHYIVTAKPR